MENLLNIYKRLVEIDTTNLIFKYKKATIHYEIKTTFKKDILDIVFTTYQLIDGLKIILNRIYYTHNTIINYKYISDEDNNAKLFNYLKTLYITKNLFIEETCIINDTRNKFEKEISNSNYAFIKLFNMCINVSKYYKYITHCKLDFIFDNIFNDRYSILFRAFAYNRKEYEIKFTFDDKNVAIEGNYISYDILKFITKYLLELHFRKPLNISYEKEVKNG